jgi:hypothetical protein
LSRIFDDRGPLDGGRIVADSMFRLSESLRDGDGSYPFTGGRYRIDPKLLSVDGIHIVARREGFEGRRKVSTT